MATAQINRTASWWTRLSERCYRTTMPQLVRDMQHEASHAFGELLGDLSAPLDSTFEREVAQQLNLGQLSVFQPARTLMPVMMQRFGLQDAEVAADPGYNAMRKTCNACPVAGQCWKAMRAGAEVEECRTFCPNAGVFERWATTA